MKNIFSGLKKKLTRRQRKGKPVPVPVEPVEKPIRAVFMSPPLQQKPRKHRAVWDEKDHVYRGQDQYDQLIEVFERSMVVPVEIFYEEPEPYSKAPESPSGYDYPRETFSSSYDAPGALYEAPTYSAPSATTDSSSSYTPSDSGGGGYSGGSE